MKRGEAFVILVVDVFVDAILQQVLHDLVLAVLARDLQRIVALLVFIVLYEEFECLELLRGVQLVLLVVLLHLNKRVLDFSLEHVEDLEPVVSCAVVEDVPALGVDLFSFAELVFHD